MNDTKKKIDVNMTSLDRLKAELLRKQEEVRKAKIDKPIDKFVPKKPEERPKVQKEKLENKPKESLQKKNYTEYEDSAALEKAKRVLQAKAKFYDKMVASGGSLNSDDNCLVLFNRKKQEDNPNCSFDYDDEIDEVNQKNTLDYSKEKYEMSLGDKDDCVNNKYEASEKGNDWVEYTDCLGRTRKCLRKDFVFCKQRDTELAKNIQPRETIPNLTVPSGSDDLAAPSGSMSSLEASVRTKYEAMKDNWEQKEKENLEKEFIHYQDVFFDEARQHGVGYYAFSTDDDERARQLKELYEIRAETLEEQKKREAERQQRDIILSERIRAAENRLRARQGLPPLEDDPTPQQEKPLTKDEEKLKRKEEKFKRRLEEKEKQKEEKRKNHIRPWDKQKVTKKITKKKGSDEESESESENTGSENDEWTYKPQREPMSQEQWNEKQRHIRNQDFAPPSAPPSFDPVDQRKEEPSTSSSVDDTIYLDTVNTNPFFFTTKKRPFQKKLFVRKNYVTEEEDQDKNNNKGPISEGIPIHNEISNDYKYGDENDDNDDDIRPPGVSIDDDDYDDDEPNAKRKGVEIPPPPTFEYYGPSETATSRKAPIKKPDIESSIEAGLKFIRNQSDKGILPTKYSWISKTDYE